MNRRNFKGIISLLLCLTLIISGNIFAADEGVTDDKAYIQASEILSGLGIVTFDHSEADKTVSRAAFAEMIVNIMELGSAATAEKLESGKFTGFTNHPDFDENGDWIWKSEEETSAAQKMENATPFKDVLTTHESWDAIKTVAAYGIMVGDPDRRFRPNDGISLIEAEKIIISLCGTPDDIIRNYPHGIIREASLQKLSENLTDKAPSSVLTVRNAAVLLYNATKANMYEIDSYISSGGEVRVKTDATLLSYFRDIYTVRGVVTASSITSLTETEGVGEGRLMLGDEEYNAEEISGDAFLGENVDVYYKKGFHDEEKTIVYIRKNDIGREEIVDSEDIVDYKNSYLIYQRSGESRKQKYIGANVNIIYNGKALTSYTDSMIVPDKGYIRFVDSSGDGSADTVFINNIETIVVSGIDTKKQIIYNQLDKSVSVPYGEGRVVATDATGEKLDITTVSQHSVLNVQRTVKSQGEPLITITCSVETVKGAITSINLKNREITVDGVVYKVAKNIDIKNLQAAQQLVFYLDADGEIVWTRKTSDLAYGFLIGIHQEEQLSDETKIKMYNIADDEIVIYDIGKRLKVNDKSVKRSEIKTTAAIYDSAAGSPVRQVVRFKLAEDGTLAEIITSGYSDDILYAVPSGDIPTASLQYRSGIRALVEKTPAFYTDTQSAYINIPETDFNNDSLYYKRTLVHDQRYTFDSVYKEKKSSAVASVLITREDAASAEGVKNSIQAYMVTDIARTMTEEQEDCYEISGVGFSGSVTRILRATELFDIAEDLEIGDIIRFATRGKLNEITALEKIFDRDKRSMVQTTKGVNPYASDTHFVSELNVLHGQVIAKPDEGKFIKVAPYNYSVVNNEAVKGDPVTEEMNMYTVNAAQYKCFILNERTNTVKAASAATDIYDRESTGRASDIVVYTQWSDPKAIFIYE